MDYIPSTDKGKRDWAVNLSDLLTATPAAFGILPATAAAYQTLVDTYVADLAAATDPSTRGTSTITTKNTSRQNLMAASRAIVATLQGVNPPLTATQKQNLGITDRGANGLSPIPVPTKVPVPKIISVNGWTTDVQITTAGSTSRRLPSGCAGINIYSFHGAGEPPADPMQWTYEGESSRSRFKIAADPSLPVGTKMFYTFCFKNPRYQVGPACAAVSVVIGGGVPETVVG